MINFVDDVMDKNYGIISFILKYLYFKKAYSSQFCWIVKIAKLSIKTIFKDSKVADLRLKEIKGSIM